MIEFSFVVAVNNANNREQILLRSWNIIVYNIIQFEHMQSVFLYVILYYFISVQLNFHTLTVRRKLLSRKFRSFIIIALASSVFKNTFYYLIGAVLQIAFALFLAYIVSAKYRGADFYKGVIFFPALLNGVAVSMIFLFFYREGGPLDDILVALGHNADTLPHWIGDSHMVNLSLVFAMLWRYIGQNVIVFSGAILSTDKVALEEAKLDGATDWQRFIYIVLPRLKPTIAVGMILAVKNAISIFEIPFIITGGENGSSTFVVQTIKTAFDSRKAGMASAMGIVLLVIILVISIIQNKYGVSEEDE